MNRAVRAVVQRVKRAAVRVGDELVASIGPGVLVYLGVGASDTAAAGAALSDKIANLRIFPSDDRETFDRSVVDARGEALVVSQFTLYGDTRKGRRPSFTAAMAPEPAKALYETFLAQMGATGVPTRAGRFGAMMDVDSVNWGPVTLMLSTD